MLDYRMYRILKDTFTYDEFRSEIYHYLKCNSTKDFVEQIISYTIIQSLIKKNENAKALYLLALFDYYCHEYNAPGLDYFSEYRNLKLKDKQYPDAVWTEFRLTKDENVLVNFENQCKNNHYSSFFLKYNIYEIKER